MFVKYCFLFFLLCSSTWAASVFYPSSVTDSTGSHSTDQAVSVLSVNDQSGTIDNWAKYIEFTPATTYSGIFNFNLGSAFSVAGLTLKVNYKGEQWSSMHWTWEIYQNPQGSTAGSWATVGTSQSAAAWIWTLLTFTPTSGIDFTRVVSSANAVKIRMSSNNNVDNSDIDYVQLSLTTSSGSATLATITTTTTTASATTVKSSTTTTGAASITSAASTTTAASTTSAASTTGSSTCASPAAAPGNVGGSATWCTSNADCNGGTCSSGYCSCAKGKYGPKCASTVTCGAGSNKATCVSGVTCATLPGKCDCATTSVWGRDCENPAYSWSQSSSSRLCGCKVYKPLPGTTWQWQISSTFVSSTTQPVEMFDVDLFEISVTDINNLHAVNKSVICYFSTQYESYRPDSHKFMPNIIGNALDTWPGEAWADITSNSLKQILYERMQFAKQKGCDGVEPDNVDGYAATNTGFGTTYSQSAQIAFNKWLAQTAHSFGLSVGLKNDMENITALQPYFDWALNEQCNTYSGDDCTQYDVFVQNNKAVFGTDYLAQSATSQMSTICGTMNARRYSWIIKDVDQQLDARTWAYCCASSYSGGNGCGFKGHYNCAL